MKNETYVTKIKQELLIAHAISDHASTLFWLKELKRYG